MSDGSAVDALRTSMERLTAQVWEDVLALSPGSVTPSSHFFDIGGTSLTAIQMIQRLQGDLQRLGSRGGDADVSSRASMHVPACAVCIGSQDSENMLRSSRGRGSAPLLTARMMKMHFWTGLALIRGSAPSV